MISSLNCDVFHFNQTLAYRGLRKYDEAWMDVKMCRILGTEIPQRFVDMLNESQP